jgi:hypothetical protein
MIRRRKLILTSCENYDGKRFNSEAVSLKLPRCSGLAVSEICGAEFCSVPPIRGSRAIRSSVMMPIKMSSGPHRRLSLDEGRGARQRLARQ